MDNATIQRLNDINRQFYETVADSFDETRGQAWPGWKILLPYLNFNAQGKTFSVLDVGCGNGRFGIFLAEYLQAPVTYHGIDNNPALLSHAQEALKSRANITLTLEQRDVVISPPEAGLYDLVVLFGLIHHIPGNENRRQLIRRIAARVKPGGLMAFACWRFYEYERFKQRILPWPDDLIDKVEQHDYLLDWRREDTQNNEYPRRYCHYVDSDEHNALITVSGLTEIHTFRADGFTNTVNRYSLLQR